MASDRRKEILIAAGTCFARYGYEKTTIGDIGEMVGMNKVSLYYYFKNKEAIFTEVIRHEADDFAEELEKKVRSIAGCRERILAWIEESFNYKRTTSVLHQLSLSSLRRLSSSVEELKKYAMERGTEYLAAVLEEARKKNEAGAVDARKAAQAIQNVIFAMKDQAYRDSRAGLSDESGFRKTVEDILVAVSLILDGIFVKESV